MRKMKDSGVEWIGEIPDKWQTRKLFYLLSLIGSGTTPKGDEYYTGIGIPWLNTGDLNDGYIYSTNKYVSENALNDYSALQVYKPRSIVIAMYGATIGKLGLTEIELTTNQACCVMNTTKEMDRKILFYILMTAKDYFIFLSYGAGQPNISQKTIKHLKIPFANICEQKKIANYLDAKCSKIDEIIEKQLSIIEKLKEYKLSIITEAVTKGINPDVELKDSTIDMCEQIPVHWSISQNRYLFSLRDEKNYKPLEEVRLLSLYTDLGVFPHGEQEERGNKAVKAEGYKVVYENDIVVNIILAWMGAIGRSAYDGVTSPAYDIYKPNENVCSRYYHYLYRTKPFSAECYKYGRGIMAMRWRTYSSEFKSIKVPVPPYIEQCQIADYLDSKCEMLDKTIADRNKAIEKLQEYKKSLIYEVVTGKKEV